MAVDPIIADLFYVMETGQELDILNFHKSFPITCKGRVEAIQKNQATIRVQPPGSVCLSAEEHTIVLSHGLPEAVRARVLSFDLFNGLVVLGDFGSVGAHFGDRMIARVQPGDPIAVSLQTAEGKVEGQLADVSLSGAGVFVKNGAFKKEQEIELWLPLPGGTVKLKGKLLSVIAAGEGQSRLSVSFTHNVQDIALVMRYVKDRRTEILSEIEVMYEEAYTAAQEAANKDKG